MKSREIGDYGVLRGLQMSQEYDKKSQFILLQ